MQHEIEVVNGVFSGIFHEMADIYEKYTNGILYEYMTSKDREFICAHFPGMEDFFPLYALYAAAEKKQGRIELEMLIWVVKDKITQHIVFYVNPSFDRDNIIRTLLSQAMEDIRKYLPSKIRLGRME